jgi:hypothetical protein
MRLVGVLVERWVQLGQVKEVGLNRRSLGGNEVGL